MSLKRKILTCVPKQLHEEKEKLDWIDNTLKNNPCDIMVLPQEFFGGQVIMPQKPFYKENEILPQLLQLTKKYNVGMIIGIVEQEKEKNYERIWFLDEHKLLGKITKFALPNYSRKGGNGCYQTHNEENLRDRFKTFNIKGLNIAGYFCWEVFSDALWFGLRQIEPDFVANLIKFGVNAYPKKEKRNDGRIWVKGFANMGSKTLEEDYWFQRIKFASLFEVLCPVFTSCNTWNLSGKSMPFNGMVYDMSEDSNYWSPDVKCKKGTIPESVIVQEFDFDKVRYMKKHKFEYIKNVGEFPTATYMKLTMAHKIFQVEKKRLNYLKKLTNQSLLMEF